MQYGSGTFSRCNARRVGVCMAKVIDLQGLCIDKEVPAVMVT